VQPLDDHWNSLLPHHEVPAGAEEATSQRIMTAIVELTQRDGRPPTCRQVLSHAGMHSHNRLAEHLEKLVRSGRLQRLTGSRILIVADRSAPASSKR
jgi:SOS-response transcriptional repressor LexA